MLYVVSVPLARLSRSITSFFQRAVNLVQAEEEAKAGCTPILASSYKNMYLWR
jgi:hypothetical protein